MPVTRAVPPPFDDPEFSSPMSMPRSGFMIPRKYEFLYNDFWKPAPPEMVVYAVPRLGVPAEAMPKKYRGIDRYPLGGWPVKEHDPAQFGITPAAAEPEAAEAINDLVDTHRSDGNFIFSLDDGRRIFSMLRRPDDWELIWVADATASVPPPPDSMPMGFDATWFWGDHFSAICDSMCFPRWHGTDAAGRLFASHFEKLNQYALFPTAGEAEDFLRFYRSQDWTETGEYVIAEIRLVIGGAIGHGASG